MPITTKQVKNNSLTAQDIAAETANGLSVAEHATVTYDFALHGGAIGEVVIPGAPKIPAGYMCYVDAYIVHTTCVTAGADAGTIRCGFNTDGWMFNALAVSDASNPWDAGGAVQGQKALAVAAQTPVLTTAERDLRVVIATQAFTAGKITFRVSYWKVS